MDISWFALYTRPRFEKKVFDRLDEAGFEAWLPLHTVVRQWTDRKKKVEVPLFNSYVFIHIDKNELHRAVQTDGVVAPIRFNGIPAPIRDDQIEMIKKILMGPDAFEIEETSFSKGDPVKIIDGQFKGFKGKWVNWRGRKKVALEIEQMNYAFLIEVPAAYVQKENPGDS